MYIVLAILIFGILIAVHELGHFLAAKACGVKVLEYAIGMGPVILKKQGKETLYSLRLLPIGGFCSMEGEDTESEDPRSFSSQSAWKKLIILIAGALMNFVFGLLLIMALFAQTASFTTPTITDFYEGCPYVGEDGFLEGDTIYKIDGHRIYFTNNVSTYMSRVKGDTVDIVLIRDGGKIYLDDYPLQLVEYEENGGTVMRYGLYFGVKETGVLSTLKYSWYCSLDFVRLVWMSLSDLVSGAVGISDLSGVVGIVSIMNDVGQSSATTGDAMYNITYLGAFIAVNLAVLNVLPIPALDGGRILFVVVNWLSERVLRRKLNPKYEGYVHAAGFVLLLGLMVFVLINDIWKLIG